MIIKGHARILGDNINTDDIIAAKYLDSQDPVFLGSKCMENLDPGFAARLRQGDIIVAGKNFGCGSSREHAPWAIKGCGISLVIAHSFARIFFRNAINIGLPIIEFTAACPIEENDELEVDLAAGTVKNRTKDKACRTHAFPAFLEAIIKSGGLIPWIKQKGGKQ